MAITQNTFTGNGSNLGPFSFTFKWLEPTDIKVTVGGVLKTAGTHYNLQSLNYTTKDGGQVLFTAGNAPANNATIRVYRDTDDSALSATFFSGSAIRAQDLNDDFTQNLYVTQEVNNNAVNIDGSNPMVGDLNMGGYKVTNLATPVAGTDAANRSFVEGVFSSEVPVFYRRWSKTAAGGETSLSGNDNSGSALSYVPGSEKVFINGALQVRGVDYSGTTGSTLTGIPALIAGDIVEVHSSSSYTVGTVPDGSVTNAKVDGGAGIQSTKLAFIQSGSGATTRTVAAKLADVVSVKDFGAVGDGVADDTAAIQAAITYCKTLASPKLVINNGTFAVSSALTFDLPNYSTIEFQGTIVSSVSAAAAVQIGSSTTNTFGLTVSGLKVQRTSIDSAGSSIGIRLRNLVSSYVDIRRCINFRDGVVCLGDQSNGGFSYNELHLGFLHDNRRNLWLTASNGSSGYCNENNFFGGTFNHGSVYPAVSTVNLEIEHYPTNTLNNNRFFGPSFEDNSVLAVAATINGSNNIIYAPRLENPSNQALYPIQFTANTVSCSLLGVGFNVLNTNISNLGIQNIYETRDKVFISNQAGTGTSDGVLALQTSFSASSNALNIFDSGMVSRYRVTGDGTLFSNSRGYFQTGIRFNTTSGTFNDRGIFSGSGSPEGVVTAEPGSLYCRANGGANTSLYVKESGGGNTGWVAK